MATTVGLRRLRSAREILIERGAAEFARAQDERVIQQATPIEVFDQAGQRFVVLRALLWKRCFDPPVMILGPG